MAFFISGSKDDRVGVSDDDASTEPDVHGKRRPSVVHGQHVESVGDLELLHVVTNCKPRNIVVPQNAVETNRCFWFSIRFDYLFKSLHKNSSALIFYRLLRLAHTFLIGAVRWHL